MKVTVVDMGNYNYKYDGAKGVGIFSSKYTREPQSYPEGMERIEVDGETTFIGIGKLEREFNKSNKNSLKHKFRFNRYNTKRGNVGAK